MRCAELGDATVMKWESGIIANPLDHMVRIVDDLLDVSRISRGT